MRLRTVCLHLPSLLARTARPVVRGSVRTEFQNQPRVTLVVGIASYPDSSNLNPLTHSAADATAVEASLKGMGYAVRALRNESARARAIRATRDSPVEEGVALEEIDQWRQKTRAKRRIMPIDACRNLSAPGSRSAFSAPRNPVEFETSQGTRILYAAESIGLSYEHPEVKHGVFTYILLRGRSGEASEGRTPLPYTPGEHSGERASCEHPRFS